MRGNGLDDAVIYAQRRKWIAAQLKFMPVTRIVPLSPGSSHKCLNQLSYLPTSSNWLMQL